MDGLCPREWDGLSKKHKIAAAVVILIIIIAIIGG